jgi:anaerobic ribonucleoside-triphosphate reductase
MALDPIRIDIEVNEKAFEQQLKQAEKVSRDTKTKINQTMKVKFEMDIAQFQLKLAEVKKQLKTATGNQKISLQVEANQLQR